MSSLMPSSTSCLQHGSTTNSRMSGASSESRSMSRGVLRGDDDGVQADGLVAVVLDGDLGLAVGAQVRDGPVLADLGQAAGEPVRQVDRQRHQLGRLVAGVAEHQALVAGALLVQLVLVALDPVLVRGVDALRDVRGLRADGHRDAAGGAVEALLRGVVADVEDLVAHELGDVGVRLGGHLTGDVHQAGGDQGLHGDPGRRVLLEERVEDGVADLVSDLVGVTLGHGLRGEQAAGHIAPWGCSGCWLIIGGRAGSCARRRSDGQFIGRAAAARTTLSRFSGAAVTCGTAASRYDDHVDAWPGQRARRDFERARRSDSAACRRNRDEFSRGAAPPGPRPCRPGLPWGRTAPGSRCRRRRGPPPRSPRSRRSCAPRPR